MIRFNSPGSIFNDFGPITHPGFSLSNFAVGGVWEMNEEESANTFLRNWFMATYDDWRASNARSSDRVGNGSMNSPIQRNSSFGSCFFWSDDQRIVLISTATALVCFSRSFSCHHYKISTWSIRGVSEVIRISANTLMTKRFCQRSSWRKCRVSVSTTNPSMGLKTRVAAWSGRCSVICHQMQAFQSTRRLIDA